MVLRGVAEAEARCERRCGGEDIESDTNADKQCVAADRWVKRKWDGGEGPEDALVFAFARSRRRPVRRRAYQFNQTGLVPLYR